jgi:hypothetical protein
LGYKVKFPVLIMHKLDVNIWEILLYTPTTIPPPLQINVNSNFALMQFNFLRFLFLIQHEFTPTNHFSQKTISYISGS